MNAPTFHLVTGSTPGLINDADIVRAVLQARYPAFTHVLRRENLHLPHRRLILDLHKPFSRRTNVMVFFENLTRGWMRTSDRAILIPNQEWIRPLTNELVRRCHGIWCKTRYAERLFLERGLPAQFIGFSSRDMYLPGEPKDYSACIHLSGRSALKGTDTLLKVWQRHPEWPTLTVITRHSHWERYSTPNIKIVTEYLNINRLKTLMNRAGIHVCPSETEGFGHYINEALSTQAVVITTDAPPMNELVLEEFGILAACNERTPAGYGERFHVDPESLEKSISKALAMSAQEKACMGNRARIAFLAHHARFKAALLEATDSLVLGR